MTAPNSLIEELLDSYAYYKQKAISDAGGSSVVNKTRLKDFARPRIEKMAEIVENWDIEPGVVMGAVFAWAKYNKHFDGPMPNMLGSAKYLTTALSRYLQVPYEVVVERGGKTAFLERMDSEYQKLQGELESAGVTDLVTATAYPVEVRYLMALNKLDWNSVFFLSQDLLETMSKDRRVCLWLEYKGVRYEKVAAHFNKQKKSNFLK
jgi:hypothetical protein